MSNVQTVFDAMPWYAWIAIVAIVSGTISGIVKMLVTHKERMTMIQHGMHPDALTAKPHEQAEL
jgi:hypothetical protein